LSFRFLLEVNDGLPAAAALIHRSYL
jgi:hypothetical protein